ncbi:cob(I)yrinic acid a,c-diamide adenosyltransferase [Natranaerobius trueperi]|uniref:Cob(I)yrinic acid a,c-diamide adenosyltransferase n=1 Tax=Natranaerobius trueperi TaxID=759412 RepID=A0A226BVG7_9FIRM|nr:cob(I)yrinic acid a,c-diamide adenosyltransferase [Natranaerobius trueperi]OWZ82983.1 cob(I)yrinic acid a,c-diamide adenosyltransferase [Natranaerobius trueperi]
MSEQNRGLIFLYTGSGKGKTTAAIGLCFRALGHGSKSCIIQFVKGKENTGEVLALEYVKGQIDIIPMGQGLIRNNPTPTDIEMANKALEKAKELIFNSDYEIIVLDEINIALKKELIDINLVSKLINKKPINKHIVLTGRYAPSQLFDLCDTVTIFEEKKHHFKKGCIARKTIEF